MEQTIQVEDENQSCSVKIEIKQESVDMSDFANDNYACSIKQEGIPDFSHENDPYSMKSEIKQESVDLPDFVDAGDYSDDPTGNKPKKQYGFYRCPTCGTKYWKQSYLELHQAIHDPRGICPVCAKPIAGDLPYEKRLYKQHINQHIRTKMREDKERECTCPYCQKRFSTRRKLKLHVRVHTGERPYKCNICREQFKLLGAMRDHEFTHSVTKEFVCDKCDGRFTTSSSLSRHMKRKHQVKQHFDCKQCDSKFSNVGLLKAHQKKVHTVNNIVNFKRKSQNGELSVKSQKQTYECILCGDLLSNIVLYSEHRRLHLRYTKEEYEEKKSQRYPCRFCSRSFTALQNVFRHLHVHMAKTDKCQLCNDYYTKYGLKRHMIRCHKNLQCKVCSKFQLGKHKLYRHYQKYHSKVIRKFPCTLCNVQFITKNALYKHHGIVHVQNNYVQCNFCVAKFVFSEDLAAHITSSHMKDNKGMLAVPKNYWTVLDNPIRCPKCTRILTMNSYKAHNKSCKNKIRVENAKLKCKFCNRILLNSISYRKHTKMHSSFIFQCKYCTIFLDKSTDLKEHRKNHHIRGKMYWCNLCNRNYKKIHELMRHKMSHFMKKVNNS